MHGLLILFSSLEEKSFKIQRQSSFTRKHFLAHICAFLWIPLLHSFYEPYFSEKILINFLGLVTVYSQSDSCLRECVKNKLVNGVFSVVNLFLLIFFHLEVDNTDAEGRLLLADALCYAHNFNARAIVNAATLTGKQSPSPASFWKPTSCYSHLKYSRIKWSVNLLYYAYKDSLKLKAGEMTWHAAGQELAEILF